MASNLPGLENILDNLDVGIIIFDNKGTYLFVNKTLLQYTGRTRQDYLNHTVYDFIASGLYKESVVDKVYHEKRAVTQIHVTVSADGKQVGRLVTVSPIFNAQGEIVYAISCQIQVDAMNQKYSHAKAINAIATGIRGNWDDRREVIAKVPPMVGVLRQAARAAQSDASVLLLGESGTGKEIVAQYIHQHSPYRKKQMVAINCTSLPESLLEAELFGYEKGAFTGAASGGKIGLIEAAANNTLLLDEVNSMPLSLQAKLLRVLETKAVIPVGSVKPRAVNFRLICASNVALAQCVKEGTFRMDLYYRLNVIPNHHSASPRAPGGHYSPGRLLFRPLLSEIRSSKGIFKPRLSNPESLQMAGKHPRTAQPCRAHGGYERVIRGQNQPDSHRHASAGASLPGIRPGMPQ